MSGVLSASAIKAFAEREDPELIVEGYQSTSVQPASYNVRIAETGLITRDKTIPPRPGRQDGDTDDRATDQPTEKAQDLEADDAAADATPSQLAKFLELLPRPTPPPVVLEPGDTAVFCSRERFALPMCVAGNVTVKNTYAAKGLMLLSGLLIDPGYGKGHDAHGDGRAGCPLYLHVANIGRERMTLIPGCDDIARIQFLHVDEELDATDLVSGSRWENQALVSLGFLSDLKQLKENVEHTDTRTQLVLGGGVAVILVALIGAALSSILSIATDKELTGDLQGTWGSLSLGQSLMWAALFLGIPILSVAVVLGYSKLTTWLGRRRRLKRRVS